MSGAARALWLSELTKAIDEAQWLAWRIGVVEGRNALALELYVRLELVRAEVEALQGRKRSGQIEKPPSIAFAESSLDPFGKLASTREGFEK